MLNNFLFQPEYQGYFWLVLAIIFLLAEIGTPGLFVFINFSIGAFCAGILAFFGFSLKIQCIIGLVVSIISFLIFRHFFANKFKDKIETNVDALIGKHAVVIKKIEPNIAGLVRIDNETWPARSKDNKIFSERTIVKIVEIKGNHVIVKD
ncbi:NfeD family protein [Candidatus Babeliales bacterium]|nr:NfeD family protein [Candidatus Babeliales bacterium]MCF7899372.1 NfeD family protein [Candidatus Babeliales bacterium]